MSEQLEFDFQKINSITSELNAKLIRLNSHQPQILKLFCADRTLATVNVETSGVDELPEYTVTAEDITQFWSEIYTSICVVRHLIGKFKMEEDDVLESTKIKSVVKTTLLGTSIVYARRIVDSNEPLEISFNNSILSFDKEVQSAIRKI
ncbi:hypothetical protein [Vibrio sp. D431a]|uniref:hypothetical protein n=1 Tax=Vibrio sp. D431a TaxID=2837388 RepID=UPI00255638A9|nr:hypothetical protein [Vibrio sp. D431a]MDK9793739.1 hypothetical protein [Vibrio sp. D431a]